MFIVLSLGLLVFIPFYKMLWEFTKFFKHTLIQNVNLEWSFLCNYSYAFLLVYIEELHELNTYYYVDLVGLRGLTTRLLLVNKSMDNA